MSSTRYIAALFPDRVAFVQVLQEASRLSKLSVRIVILAFSSSLFLSYFKSRFCFICGLHFSAEHFFWCPELGQDISRSFRGSLEEKDWMGAVMVHFVSVSSFGT
jgi:hypothetical protein